MSHLNIADYLYKAAINYHAENYFMIRSRYTSTYAYLIIVKERPVI